MPGLIKTNNSSRFAKGSLFDTIGNIKDRLKLKSDRAVFSMSGPFSRKPLFYLS
jgi:hypothetical protein